MIIAPAASGRSPLPADRYYHAIQRGTVTRKDLDELSPALPWRFLGQGHGCRLDMYWCWQRPPSVRARRGSEPPAHCRLVSDHDLFETVAVLNCTAGTLAATGGDGRDKIRGLQHGA
jgi:hypothetical protein